MGDFNARTGKYSTGTFDEIYNDREQEVQHWSDIHKLLNSIWSKE
jgi:hypothetical protein